MLRIKDASIDLGDENKKEIAKAHATALIQEYGDRRIAMATSRLQKVGGYLAATLGIAALVAGITFAPYIAAPTALGLLKVSGALAAEVGGATLGIGLVRGWWNGSRLKRIPGRA